MIPSYFPIEGQSNGEFHGADGTAASGTADTATVGHSHESGSEGAGAKMSI